MIVDGQKIRDNKLQQLEKKSQNLTLGVVQVGTDEVSETFISEKRKASQKVGFGFNHYKFSSNILLSDLKQEIKRLPDDGLIVQLPLPEELDTQKVLNAIPFEKDVDVLSEASLGKFYSGELDILPPVVKAIEMILNEYNISLKNKHLVVIGPGRLVGKPTVIYGINQGATISIINKHTEDVSQISKKGDVLVTGVGEPNMIDQTMVKEGATVIDAGTSKVEGQLVGDVDFESVKKKAGVLTPVPGGVGPLTVCGLLNNLSIRYGD